MPSNLQVPQEACLKARSAVEEVVLPGADELGAKAHGHDVPGIVDGGKGQAQDYRINHSTYTGRRSEILMDFHRWRPQVTVMDSMPQHPASLSLLVAVEVVKPSQ